MTYIPPERQPAVEGRVREALQSVDALLDIKWIFPCRYNASMQNAEGWYALIAYYGELDGRRHIDAAGFDVLGWFCEDMNDASSTPVNPEASLPQIRNYLSEFDGERHGVRDRLRAIQAHNQDVREASKRAYTDEGVQAALDIRRQVYGIPFVPVTKDIN